CPSTPSAFRSFDLWSGISLRSGLPSFSPRCCKRRGGKPGARGRSIDTEVPTARNKETNTARHVRADLRAQGDEILSQQRPQQQRQENNIEKDSRGRLEVIRREGGEPRELL